MKIEIVSFRKVIEMGTNPLFDISFKSDGKVKRIAIERSVSSEQKPFTILRSGYSFKVIALEEEHLFEKFLIQKRNVHLYFLQILLDVPQLRVKLIV
jgi:hypothetical protein